MSKLIHIAIIEGVIKQVAPSNKQKENALHSLECLSRKNSELEEQVESLKEQNEKLYEDKMSLIKLVKSLTMEK